VESLEQENPVGFVKRRQPPEPAYSDGIHGLTALSVRGVKFSTNRSALKSLFLYGFREPMI